ncbi:MAG: hypothetical protein ACYTFW_23055, partial [Planctomycetota bacterium]
MTTFGDQVFEYGGSPVGSARFTNPWETHYFVDATNGSDANDGKSPTDAKATIQAMITAANGGDVIYVNPQTYKLGTGFNRYTEDVSVTMGGAGGSGVVSTNANMSLIGVTPANYPTDFLGVRWTYATATPLTIDAPCFHIENIGFFSEGATYHIHLRNNGATRTREGTTGFTAYNCAFKGDAKVYGEGANELSIVKCRFQAKYDGTVSGINLVGSANQVVRPVIANCDFIGGNGTAMSDAAIIGAAPWHDAVIRDNYFANDSTTGIFINIAGSTSTG